MNPTPPRDRFLGVILLATAVFACALVAGSNLLVDPFGAWRLVDIPGFNTWKPALQRRVKLAKAHDLRRLAPSAIVLGTSRSQIAMRPSHPGWAVPLERRYNAAFDGATTWEMEAYLRHAHAIRPLKQVVLGLDTWQLGRGPASVRPDFDASQLKTSAGFFQTVAVWASDARLLLSLDTLWLAAETLRAQDHNTPEWLAPDGQRLGPVFFRQIDTVFQNRGTGAYLRDVDRREAGYKLPDPPGRRPAPVAAQASGQNVLTSFDHIARIVAFCRDQGIDLRIFITPAHAHQLELSAEVGEWPVIEQGKRDLVVLLARDATDHPGERPFPLVDFSGYSAVTTEEVPPIGSKVEMAYYWDSSHFKEIVGDWILDRLFGVYRPENPPPAGFGVALTPDTVEKFLAETRQAHEQYCLEHPGDARFIAATVTEVRQKKAALAAARSAGG